MGDHVATVHVKFWSEEIQNNLVVLNRPLSRRARNAIFTFFTFSAQRAPAGHRARCFLHCKGLPEPRGPPCPPGPPSPPVPPSPPPPPARGKGDWIGRNDGICKTDQFEVTTVSTRRALFTRGSRSARLTGVAIAWPALAVEQAVGSSLSGSSIRAPHTAPPTLRPSPPGAPSRFTWHQEDRQI